MDNIKTELGKIYCKYNPDTDDFDMIRLTEVKKYPEENNKILYFFSELDSDYHIKKPKENENQRSYSEDEYNQIKSSWVLLKSEGIASLTNIIAMRRDDGSDLRDILMMFFPCNKVTKEPDINNPYVVARQGINNIFAELVGYNDIVGMSVSLETLPPDWALIDFMTNDGTLSTSLTHVYKTDTATDLSYLLNNEESNEIFKEFFDKHIHYLENTRPGYKYEKKDHDCLDGYCTDLFTFINESDFMNDIYSTIGILRTDIIYGDNRELDDDERLFLSTQCGGIRIKKAASIKFAYDVNLEMIKMKYMLVLDSAQRLFIVWYTESSDEIPAEELYNLTEERTKLLQERMMKIIATYSESSTDKGDKLVDINTQN